MEQVLNNNVSVPRKLISSNKKKSTINIQKVANKMLKKLFIQTILCCILITAIYLYKIYFSNSFEYINQKYSWLVKYNMTYVKEYNKVANYLNNRFDFKISLKKENNNANESENIYTEINNIEENTEIDTSSENLEIMDELQDGAVLVSVGYDNMRIIADEIREKYNWVVPTNGKITSPFGVRDPSRPDISAFHMGVDLANTQGTEIVAAIAGNVIEATYDSTYGNYIKIATDDVITIYAHCSTLFAKQGENVSAGTKIALMGSSGISTGPHLHFEVRKNNQVINPEYILNLR